MNRQELIDWALENGFFTTAKTGETTLLRQGKSRGEILYAIEERIRYEQVSLSMPLSLQFAIEVPYKSTKLRSGDVVFSLGSRSFTVSGR